ncbi:MAG: hypothetical protein IPP29_04760 [Bacteroidetes bacterium]|nr:hypothetical protein [Bacteroidota bacterium]
MLINLLRSIHCRSALANGFFGGKKAFAANEKHYYAEIASYLAMTNKEHGSSQTKRRTKNNSLHKRNEPLPNETKNEEQSSPQTKRRTKNNSLHKRKEERRTMLTANETKNEEQFSSQTKRRTKNNPHRKRNEELTPN